MSGSEDEAAPQGRQFMDDENLIDMHKVHPQRCSRPSSLWCVQQQIARIVARTICPAPGKMVDEAGLQVNKAIYLLNDYTEHDVSQELVALTHINQHGACAFILRDLKPFIKSPDPKV